LEISILDLLKTCLFVMKMSKIILFCRFLTVLETKNTFDSCVLDTIYEQ